MVEITGFTIRKLGSLDVLKSAPRLTAAEMEFDERDGVQPLSPAEERLAHNLSQGILPAEGVDAFARALALGLPQVVVSSMDLDALTRQTAAATADREDGGAEFERPQLDGDFVAPETPDRKDACGHLGGSAGRVESRCGGQFLRPWRAFAHRGAALFADQEDMARVDLPISVLFEAPTIRKCAALIEAERTGDGG